MHPGRHFAASIQAQTGASTHSSVTNGHWRNDPRRLLTQTIGSKWSLRRRIMDAGGNPYMTMIDTNDSPNRASQSSTTCECIGEAQLTSMMGKSEDSYQCKSQSDQNGLSAFRSELYRYDEKGELDPCNLNGSNKNKLSFSQTYYWQFVQVETTSPTQSYSENHNDQQISTNSKFFQDLCIWEDLPKLKNVPKPIIIDQNLNAADQDDCKGGKGAGDDGKSIKKKESIESYESETHANLNDQGNFNNSEQKQFDSVLKNVSSAQEQSDSQKTSYELESKDSNLEKTKIQEQYEQNLVQFFHDEIYRVYNDSSMTICEQNYVDGKLCSPGASTQSDSCKTGNKPLARFRLFGNSSDESISCNTMSQKKQTDSYLTSYWIQSLDNTLGGFHCGDDKYKAFLRFNMDSDSKSKESSDTVTETEAVYPFSLNLNYSVNGPRKSYVVATEYGIKSGVNDRFINLNKDLSLESTECENMKPSNNISHNLHSQKL